MPETIKIITTGVQGAVGPVGASGVAIHGEEVLDLSIHPNTGTDLFTGTIIGTGAASTALTPTSRITVGVDYLEPVQYSISNRTNGQFDYAIKLQNIATSGTLTIFWGILNG
jgi:hypothetical protein